jgi:hypothetical protein
MRKLNRDGIPEKVQLIHPVGQAPLQNTLGAFLPRVLVGNNCKRHRQPDEMQARRSPDRKF